MNKHIGSRFDDFLEEENVLAETEAVAVKRVLTYQIEQMMKAERLSKTDTAKRMRTSRAALDRLLDPSNTSVTLLTMERAARALKQKLKIELAA